MAQIVIDMLVAALKEGLYRNEPSTLATNTPTNYRQWCEDVLKPAVLN